MKGKAGELHLLMVLTIQIFVQCGNVIPGHLYFDSNDGGIINNFSLYK